MGALFTKAPAGALARAALTLLGDRDPACWASVVDVATSFCFVVTDFWSPASNRASNHVQVGLALLVACEAGLFLRARRACVGRGACCCGDAGDDPSHWDMAGEWANVVGSLLYLGTTSRAALLVAVLEAASIDIGGGSL